MFSGQPKQTKIEAFQQKVKDKVLSKEIYNNFELLNFVYDEGHIPKHASDCLKLLKKEKIIDYNCSSPLITYDNVYKNQRKLEYIIL